MQQPSWQDVMLAYHNAKFSVIPLSEKRTPFHKDWSRWNKELPEDCLYKPQQKGMGVLPGPESGVMFVDIDTEDPELIRILKTILPTSPVQRFGSKGVGIAYAYNADIHSRKFTDIKVELFADSGYVVVPPSYHDKTGGYYKWIGPSLLEFPREDLPSFGTEVIETLEKLNDEFRKYNEQLNRDKKIDRGGRHNALLAQAFAALHKGKEINAIAEELAQYDLSKHEVSWFKEEMKAKDDADVLKKAHKFVQSAIKTFEKKNGPIISVEESASEEIEPAPQRVFQIKNYPETGGAIGQIASLIEESAYTQVPNMAFGSAIAIFSALVGNHYTFEGVAGNVFCLLLADSGTGKKFGIEIAKTLLAEHGRIGSANYLSSGSIISNLEDFVVRLDTSDEFSKTLKLMQDGGVWQKSMPQELCDLWSASAGQLINNVSAKKVDGKKAAPLIHKPFVSILAATTISEFKHSVNKSLFTSGLMPRCLFFTDSSAVDSKPRLDHKKIQGLTEAIQTFVRGWIQMHPTDMMTGAPMSREMKVHASINEYFDDKMRLFHFETFEFEEGSAHKAMMTRKREFYKKLALLHALSRGENEYTVRKEDLEWAEHVFNTSIYNQENFVREAASENAQQSVKERVYNLILENYGVSKSDLIRRTQYLGAKQRDAILQDLKDADRIDYRLKKSPKNGKMVTHYFAL